MKLAISNIAWEPEEDNAVITLMQQYGVTGVEIAPTKIWPDPVSASDNEIRDTARRWQQQGITISSMQALLFGHPELLLFADPATRQQTLDYLAGIIRVGGLLGAGALVFGSPKNRRVGDMPRQQAHSIAVDFFGAAGEIAQQHGCRLCIEPNPTDYGCDFVTDSQQARELVAQVNHPGFGLHLDAAGMVMSGEDITQQIKLSADELCHFHISEVNLDPVGGGSVDHRQFGDALDRAGYNNWYAIEMRASGPGRNLAAIESSLQYVSRIYSRRQAADPSRY